MAVKPKKKVAKPKLATVNGKRAEDSAPWDEDADETSGVQAYDVSADAPPRPPSKRKRSPATDFALPENFDAIMDDDAFTETMERLAERVGDLKQTYNGTAIKEETVRALLAANLQLLPVAKNVYLQTKRDKDSYAWANLAQMNQSLIAEMNTMVTTDEQAARLIADVLTPAFEGIVSYVGAELGELQRNLASANDMPEMQRMLRKSLNEFSRAFATYTQEAANRSELEIVRVLK